MKKLQLFVISILLLVAGCAPSAQEKASKEKAKQDSISVVSSDASNKPMASEVTDSVTSGKKGDKIKAENKPESIWDSSFIKRNSYRKLIKTANLNFKVKNVEKATQKIEQITNRFGGFILSSSVKNYHSTYNEYRISNDSVMSIGTSSIENRITLRVPDYYLDSTLFYFSKIWLQLDERSINAEDVTIQLLSNEIRAQLYQKTANKINTASTQPKSKLNDVVDAQNAAATYLENTINKKISNLELQDKIDFSTITLYVYQDKVLFKSTIASVDPSAYNPGFASEFVDSLAFGWKIFMVFVLFLVKCWSIILISLLFYLAIYYFIKFLVARNRKKKADNTTQNNN